MHGQIGHQHASAHEHRRGFAQKRGAEALTFQLHHVKAGLAYWDADHFKCAISMRFGHGRSCYTLGSFEQACLTRIGAFAVVVLPEYAQPLQHRTIFVHYQIFHRNA